LVLSLLLWTTLSFAGPTLNVDPGGAPIPANAEVLSNIGHSTVLMSHNPPQWHVSQKAADGKFVFETFENLEATKKAVYEHEKNNVSVTQFSNQWGKEVLAKSMAAIVAQSAKDVDAKKPQDVDAIPASPTLSDVGYNTPDPVDKSLSDTGYNTPDPVDKSLSDNGYNAPDPVDKSLSDTGYNAPAKKTLEPSNQESSGYGYAVGKSPANKPAAGAHADVETFSTK
jgi:hypothetical protein